VNEATQIVTLVPSHRRRATPGVIAVALARDVLYSLATPIEQQSPYILSSVTTSWSEESELKVVGEAERV
jgi:hypothetical protein